MTDITPENHPIISKILFSRFGLRAGYLEYQKSKKIADAMADNEARKISIAGEIEEKIIREKLSIIDELEQADRYIEYKNLYSVLTKAVPKITYSGGIVNMDIDPDKLKRLKDISKEFSSDEMQEYIACILAGEYNKPGSYSLQTMSIVKNLGRSELELFEKFSALALNGYLIPQDLVGEYGNEFREKHNLQYTDFLLLQELNLISSKESIVALNISGEGESITNVSIGDRNILLTYQNNIQIHFFTITSAGKELMQIIKGDITEDYIDWLITFFKKEGVDIKNI